MFSFLKRHKPQDQFYESEQQLTLRERALRVFSKIEGLDDIKEMMLRALESRERAHTLLTGPPACAKSKQEFRNSLQKISIKKLTMKLTRCP